MAYLKPQSPIKFNEDHIYPLTTADQIIMEDGSRWDGGTETNDKIDNAQNTADNALSKANNAQNTADNALSKAGVTSVNGETGNVTVQQLISDDGIHKAFVQDDFIGIGASDGTNSCSIRWHGHKGDLPAFVDNHDGWRGYFYGEFNKPSPADIGAAASGHEHSYIHNGEYTLITTGYKYASGFQMMYNGATTGYVYLNNNNLCSYDASGVDVRTYYSTGNKPTYADVGAAAASHSHRTLDANGAALSVINYDGVALLTCSGMINGETRPTFALQQVSPGNSHLTLHTYKTDGSYQSGATLWDRGNLAFSLSGSTLSITVV